MVMGVAAWMRRLVRRTARFHTAGRMISATRPAISKPSAKYMKFSMSIGRTPKPRGLNRHGLLRSGSYGTLPPSSPVINPNAPLSPRHDNAGVFWPRHGKIDRAPSADQNGFHVGSLVNLR